MQLVFRDTSQMWRFTLLLLLAQSLILLTALRVDVPLYTIYVILETFFLANLLV